MNKPAALRDFLSKSIPWLGENPDKLVILANRGTVFSSGDGTLSHVVGYELQAIVVDYPLEPSTVFVPVLAWLRQYQPDLLQNAKRMESGFRFEAEFMSHALADLSITLQVTERVKVSESGGSASVEYLPEPPVDEWSGWMFDLIEETEDA